MDLALQTSPNGQNRVETISVRESNLDRGVATQLARVCDAIVAMMGPQCEAIIHDFSDVEHSIVYLAGNVTGRSLGGSVTDLLLSMMSSNPEQSGPLTYFARSPQGNRMKCVSTFIRSESTGEIVGALCINFDIEALLASNSIMESLVSFGDPGPYEERFDINPEEIVGLKIQEAASVLGLNLDNLGSDGRAEIVQALNQGGVFAFKSAHSIVADALSVSRATIYNYLKRLPES